MFSNFSIKQAAGQFWQRIFRHRAEDSIPHLVTHKRVYIVPTKRGFAFLIALLLMLVASVNYALSLGYALSFVLAGLFAATLLHTYRNLAGIRIEKIKHFDTFAGEDARFLISIKNHLKVARQGILLKTDHSTQLMIHIDAAQTTDALLTIPTLHRGVVQLGRLTLQSDWPLGLWSCWSYLHAPVTALVFPKPETNAPPLPSTVIETEGNSSTQALEGDVSDLRQYRPGDSKGSIAWKSAAKGLGLQVRTFNANHTPINAILNLDNTGQREIEDQLSRLCAWVLEAELRKSEFALHLPSETIASSRGTPHYHRALKSLALYSSTS